jgi:diguanylate cyclase (GGDEF)-like protein/PAS domain S-box-containing protein
MSAASAGTTTSARPVFGAAFERARVAMALLGASLELVRVNRPMAELLGVELAGIRGICLDSLVHPEDRALLRDKASAARDGEVDPFELRLLRRPSRSDDARMLGHDVWVEIAIEAIDALPGTAIHFLAQARNLTTERLAAERLRRLLRLHATLVGADEAVLRARSVQELFEAACQVPVDHAGFRLAWIGRLCSEDSSIELLAARGPARSYITSLGPLRADDSPSGKGPSGLAVRECRTQVVRDIATDPRMAPWRDKALAFGFASSAALPLRLDGRAAGVLSVYASEQDFFDDEVIGLLERLAENVSYAWQALEHDMARRQSEHELEEQTRRLRQRFEQTSVPSLILDPNGTIQDVNNALCALTGRARERLVGTSLATLLVEEEAASPTKEKETVVAALLARPDDIVELQLYREGEPRWALVAATPMRDALGECFEVYVQMQDVTHRHLAEELAARRQAQQTALAELGRQALADDSLTGLFKRAVRLVAASMRVEVAEILELDKPVSCLHRRAIAGPGASAWPNPTGDLALDGTLAGQVLAANAPRVVADHCRLEQARTSRRLLARGMRSSASVVIRAGEVPYGVLSVHSSVPQDFDEDEIPFLESVAHVLGAAVARKHAADELRRRAQYDRLTGLPNRAFLLQRLEELLARSAGQVAVFFIDLDRFKLVNDSLGHDAGDALLRVYGQRVRASVRPGDLVARFGGDELVVAADHRAGLNALLALAERILSALQVPIELAGQEISAGASIGIALGKAGDSPSDLLRDADVAMYRAKARGGGCAVVFDATMRAVLDNRLRLETELRRALERDELAVHYQPVVDLATGVLVGAEALVRWNHPSQGLIEPAAFVPLAEETGLVVGLGERVLSIVCADLARWRSGGAHPGFVVAVNVSARELRSTSFPAGVAATLSRHGVPPSALCLEITESVLLEDSSATLGVLADLKALGVRLSVDDFGTGYSSLAYLKRFPIDELKVDRSFVAELDDSDSQAAIVGGVVQLARALKVAVVAEGVETAGQLNGVRSLGCDRAQGFLISTPVDGDVFERRFLGVEDP